MKKIILLLALLSVLTAAYSKNEDIRPIAVIEYLKQGTRANHAPARVLIESCYYPQTGTLELSFLANFGTVTVSLENMTDGGFQDYYGNSSSGKMLIPVDPDSAYRMDIVTESGRSYYAVFFTDEDCE